LGFLIYWKYNNIILKYNIILLWLWLHSYRATQWKQFIYKRLSCKSHYPFWDRYIIIFYIYYHVSLSLSLICTYRPVYVFTAFKATAAALNRSMTNVTAAKNGRRVLRRQGQSDIVIGTDIRTKNRYVVSRNRGAAGSETSDLQSVQIEIPKWSARVIGCLDVKNVCANFVRNVECDEDGGFCTATARAWFSKAQSKNWVLR